VGGWIGFVGGYYYWMMVDYKWILKWGWVLCLNSALFAVVVRFRLYLDLGY